MLLISPPAHNPWVSSISGLLWFFSCSESGHNSPLSFLSGCQTAGSHSNLIFSVLSTQCSVFHSSCIAFYFCPLPLQHTALQFPHIFTSTCYFLFLIFYFSLFFFVWLLFSALSEAMSSHRVALVCVSLGNDGKHLCRCLLITCIWPSEKFLNVLDCVFTHLY